MSYTLAIDTSGQAANMALLCGDTVAAQGSADCFGNAETLLPLLARCLESAGGSLTDISTIAVAIGPGSFTGIRTAVATAQGLSTALGIPVVGVSVLLAQIVPRLSSVPANGGVIFSRMRASKTDSFCSAFHAVPAPNQPPQKSTVRPLDEIQILTPAEADEVLTRLAREYPGAMQVVDCPAPAVSAPAAGTPAVSTPAADQINCGINPAGLVGLALALNLTQGGVHYQVPRPGGAGLAPVYVKGTAAKTLKERQAAKNSALTLN